MPYSRLSRVLVANRGEIACRVIRAAADLGIETVAISPADDTASMHFRRATMSSPLTGRGVAAYLDIDQIVAVAVQAGCDAVHPGYGFLSENATFARAVEQAGLHFVGPRPETLAQLGDKDQARRLATQCGVAVLPGSGLLASAAEAAAFAESLQPGGLGAIVLKAVAGGGGRGMRIVEPGADIGSAFDRCRSEAAAAFGDPAVYAERLITDARHIEVQILGDGQGSQIHLWERECSLQRQHQKVVEYAPASDLDVELRDQLLAWAVSIAAAVDYRSLGTFEFLVDRSDGSGWFIEANARLQVEHTVTEAITGVDLVQAQLQIAGGATLADLDLENTPPMVGHAVQLRINTERMQPDGSALPTGGTIDRFEIPSGPGIRTDTYGTAGYTTSPAFDSLLAKLVVHTRAGGLPAALGKARRALDELVIEGIDTNQAFIANLITHPDVISNDISTRFIAGVAADLVADAAPTSSGTGELAGISIDAANPLAVLDHGRSAARATQSSDRGLTHDEIGSTVVAPLQGTIVSIEVAEGQEVGVGSPVMVMEAMKMEHVVVSGVAGIVRRVGVAVGDAIFEGHTLVVVEPADVEVTVAGASAEVDLERIRPDLGEVRERHGYGLDENRERAVDKRHGRGNRTARENVADLTDADSFVEWGPLVVAAQRRRRSLQDLIEKTPGDGLVGGIGSVNGDLFDEDHSQCIVMTYDYMVLAGTQGHQNHRKKDRLFELARELRLPVVLFAEGGGGRPGDTDGLGVAGLDCLAFALWGELSGLVPRIGINAGYCFAGNAALLGCCDVVIATEGSNVGMGGPAMIEGGGLGVFHPSEVGPVAEQVENGVIDILVKDEAEAVAAAKQYLAYFQGPTEEWTIADQRLLRHLIPENRLRIYDVRDVIETLFDTGSVLELRRGFGPGMITALARVEGRPVGVIANNPSHLAGAIDSDGADKASRFMQLCDAFDLPIISLCDTPGIMVGPEAEKTGLVRHASRMFVTGASLSVPFCTFVLRKGYGLGAQAMAAGSFKAPIFTVAWPTSEFGGMGLEGAVKLGYRNELAAITDPDERLVKYQEMVDRMYEVGKGVSMADHFEIDDVIDPAESRRWIMTALKASPAPARRRDRKREFIDTW